MSTQRDAVDEKRVVLVTGSSTGFGRLISTTLARRGYAVFASMRDIAGRNRDHTVELEELGRKENLWLKVVELDVTQDVSVDQAVKRVVDDAGKIDIVVSNAGSQLPVGRPSGQNHVNFREADFRSASAISSLYQGS